MKIDEHNRSTAAVGALNRIPGICAVVKMKAKAKVPEKGRLLTRLVQEVAEAG